MPPLDPATLRAARMRAAIAGYLPVAALTTATSLLIYGALGHAPGTSVVAANAWLAWQGGLCLTWLLLWLRYRRDFALIEPIWEHRIELPLTVLSGLGWGLTWAVFMDPDNLASIILLNVITSAAFFVFAVSTPLHALITNVGLLACALPVIAYAVWVGGPVFNWIGVGAVILALGAYLFGRVVHRIYLGAVEQAHENRRLVARLRLEKARVEAAVRDKQRFFSAASHDLRQPIQVLDNGRGIAPEHQPRVFDELYQVDNPERNRNHGVGLGLAIVKRLCALMGCSIELRATPGRGCCFTLHVEQPEPAAEPVPDPPALAPGIPRLAEVPGVEILILEDDGQLAEALRLQLDAWGFRPRSAYDTASALSALDGFAPRLALADLELRGGEAAPAVLAALERQLGRRLPALLITGRVEGDPPAVPGFPPVLLKPVAPERLHAALVALLPAADRSP